MYTYIMTHVFTTGNVINFNNLIAKHRLSTAQGPSFSVSIMQVRMCCVPLFIISTGVFGQTDANLSVDNRPDGD